MESQSMSRQNVGENIQVMKTFSHQVSPEGISLKLSKNKRSLLSRKNIPQKISAWSSSGEPDLLRGLAAIHELLADMDNLDGEEVLLPHEFVASLSD